MMFVRNSARAFASICLTVRLCCSCRWKAESQSLGSAFQLTSPKRWWRRRRPHGHLMFRSTSQTKPLGAPGCSSQNRTTPNTSALRCVLTLLAEGRVLRREPYSRTRFGAYGPPADAAGVVCGLPTVRALCARELLACDGTATDPERKIVLTERGAFVVKSGTTTP